MPINVFRHRGKIIAGVLILLAAVGADYLGLLGTRMEHAVDLLHPTFKIVDQASGRPIADAHIECFVGRKEGQCSAKPELEAGHIELNFMVIRATKRSRLFALETNYLLPEDTTVTLAFLHPNYVRYFMPVKSADLLKMTAAPTLVQLNASPDITSTQFEQAPASGSAAAESATP